MLLFLFYFPLAMAYPGNKQPMNEVFISYGYEHRNYTVTTPDGYILTIGRIHQKPSKCIDLKGPTILQHGFQENSMSFFVASRNESLGFLLADACYDVWLVNSRGTVYSRNHTSLSENDRAFWNYTYDEKGRYDLKAAIDLILEQVPEKKITFFGFSQGCAKLLICLHYHPEYSAYIQNAFFLAPVAVVAHIDVPIRFIPSKLLFLMSKYVWDIAEFPLPFHRELLTEFHNVMCRKFVTCTSIPDSYNNEYLIQEAQLNLVEHSEPFTVRQVFHYIQSYMTGKFQQYDYGPEGNQKAYGQPTPQMYNLSKSSMPVFIFHGRQDTYSIVANVKELAHQLPDVRLRYEVPDYPVTHKSFLMGRRQVNLIYDVIFKYLNAKW